MPDRHPRGSRRRPVRDSIRQSRDPRQTLPHEPTATPWERARGDGDDPILPVQLRGVVPAAALLPLRVFLGGMFLYAGLDKLLFDPRFLSASGPGSIAEQLQGFARVSPLAPLVVVIAEPLPILVGLGIALLEIAIGLGAILGLLYRWAAMGGAGLSLLFFLTASWTTRPFYLGPDLPYALAWTTLALAGSGGVLTVDAWWRSRQEAAAQSAPVRLAPWMDEPDPDRRAVLQLGLLGALTIAIGGVARFFAHPAPVTATTSGGSGATALVGGGSGSSVGAGTSLAPTDAPGTVADPTAPASAAPTDAPGSGTFLGNISQLPAGHAARFQVASTGDPGIIVHLKDDSVVAYDAVCTHAGCTVGYDRSAQLIVCPCHGAAFDPSNHAEVVGGPTDQPLPELPIKIDKATGKIYLRA